MGSMRRIVTALAFVLVALPAWSQSSAPAETSVAERAEQAKKERAARRASASTPVKSFGDEDLKGGGSKPAAASTDASTPADSPAKGDAKADKAVKTDDQAKAERRDVIQKQLVEEQKRIALIEKTMADAQKELGDITNYTYGTRRASLQKFIDDGTVELTKAHEKVSGLEEEARKLGASASR
jgi:hypothetical protein